MILAINSGIGSSIGVFRNGLPELCIEEERFNRVKNWMGFPEKAFEYLLENRIITPDNVTWIVLCDTNPASHSRQTFYKGYDNYFEFAKAKNTLPANPLKYYLKKSVIYDLYIAVRFGSKKKNVLTDDKSKTILIKKGFDEKKIRRIDHHLCHAASAYYGLAKSLKENYLVLTLDGGGDRGITSTVSIGNEGKIEKKSESTCYSIGNMYSAVTYYLGFTAHEHEYKLMGLAPYVNPKYAEQYHNYFKQFLDLKNDDTEFYNPTPLNHIEFFSRLLNDLKKGRFDNIAAGLQSFTEEIVSRWVLGNLKKHGLKKVVCAGGVFMNVKLNKLLSTLPQIEYVDVFPSCGDETNIFGAAYHTYNIEVDKKIDLLKKFTLGTLPAKNLEATITKYSERVQAVKLDNPNQFIAEQLSKNKIVARCSGNMEFGARALGNRTIMANPNNLANVNKINQSIKNRDFWMPFAPAIIWEKVETLVKVPSSLREQGSPYMMFAFDTIENKRDNIICGIHQADFTARVQFISKDRYPDFHEIISRFDDLTGVPCVLNTSFNLHGFPIVESDEQAIEVLLNSKIDLLVIDNYSFSRK